MNEATTPRKDRPRRSVGEGAIYETADGRLRGSLLVDLPNGNQKRVYVSGRTRADVSHKLDAKRKEAAVGDVTAETLAEYLPRWLAATKARVRPATFLDYGYSVDYWLKGGAVNLGKRRLTKLAPADIETRMAELTATISASTAVHARRVLRRALNDAIREGILNRNAAVMARPPRVPRAEMKTLTAAEAQRFLTATASNRYGPLYALALATGMRRGELLGLSWDDVAAGSLVVRRGLATAGLVTDEAGHKRMTWTLAEPKTAKSKRTVMLPAVAVDALKRQRSRQAAAKLAAGTAWQDRDNLVFTSETGEPIPPANLSAAFRKTLERLGLPAIRFHDLRHTAATLMLANGVPLKVVSETLGHSTIAITADVYAHVTPDLRREAAAAMDRALG